MPSKSSSKKALARRDNSRPLQSYSYVRKLLSTAHVLITQKKLTISAHCVAYPFSVWKKGIRSTIISFPAYFPKCGTTYLKPTQYSNPPLSKQTLIVGTRNQGYEVSKPDVGGIQRTISGKVFAMTKRLAAQMLTTALEGDFRYQFEPFLSRRPRSPRQIQTPKKASKT